MIAGGIPGPAQRVLRHLHKVQKPCRGTRFALGYWGVFSAKGAAAPSQSSETLPRHPFCAGLLGSLQRKGCRGTLTKFRNPAAAPVLRWVTGGRVALSKRSHNLPSVNN